MKRKQPTTHYFPRGPEIFPEAGTWQYEECKKGRRFYEGVLPGQRFPEGASPKELDRLAQVRATELVREAAKQAVAATMPLEHTAPVPSAAMPEAGVAIAA